MAVTSTLRTDQMTGWTIMSQWQLSPHYVQIRWQVELFCLNGSYVHITYRSNDRLNYYVSMAVTYTLRSGQMTGWTIMSQWQLRPHSVQIRWQVELLCLNGSYVHITYRSDDRVNYFVSMAVTSTLRTDQMTGWTILSQWQLRQHYVQIRWQVELFCHNGSYVHIPYRSDDRLNYYVSMAVTSTFRTDQMTGWTILSQWQLRPHYVQIRWQVELFCLNGSYVNITYRSDDRLNYFVSMAVTSTFRTDQMTGWTIMSQWQLLPLRHNSSEFSYVHITYRSDDRLNYFVSMAVTSTLRTDQMTGWTILSQWQLRPHYCVSARPKCSLAKLAKLKIFF